HHVAQRLWQTGTAAEGAEATLDFPTCERGIYCRLAERFGAAAAVVAAQDVRDRAVVVDLVAHGLADRVLEVVHRAARGEVEEGLGEGGDGDASVRGGVSGIEGAPAVQADPRGASCRRGGGDVRLRRLVGEQAPVECRAHVAEDRALP